MITDKIRTRYVSKWCTSMQRERVGEIREERSKGSQERWRREK
jgi:hypothetical protein